MTDNETNQTNQNRIITIVTRREVSVPPYTKWLDEYELTKLCKDAGHHFFDADAMRAFKSRLHDIRPGPDGWYFITSEKHEWATSYGAGKEPRKYTLRRLRISDTHDDLKLEEIGGEEKYATLDKARTALKYWSKVGITLCAYCGHGPQHKTWCKAHLNQEKYEGERV